ncbi:carbohydrate ABC transporter permease [Streptacidiphilus sp. PAMC 29251]
MTRGKDQAGSTGFGALLVSGYTVLLLLFGVVPTGYAIYLALTNNRGQLVGLGNFIQVVHDFRFVGALEHIGLYLVIWLVVLVVVVIGLALMLHGRYPRTSATLRFLFYVPGALAGAASVLVWMFLLDPTVSPVAWFLKAVGDPTLATVVAPSHLPVIFSIIAFWSGAGGWIVVMYGALNNISADLLEAARIDGANVFHTAIHIQIPLLKKWIAYMLILAFAAGTQIFIEPELTDIGTRGLIGNSWSPNQLAFQYAFHTNDFNDAAAISVYLLIIGLACAALLVARSGLFDTED